MAHDKKAGTHNLQSSLKPETRTTVISGLIFSQVPVSHSVHRGGGGGSLYDVTFGLAAWFHVPSGQRVLCAWSHVPVRGVSVEVSVQGVTDRHSKILDACPPQGPNSFNFMLFWENLAKSYVSAPLGEILDLPLLCPGRSIRETLPPYDEERAVCILL